MMNASEAENAETWIAGNLDESAHAGFAFTLTSQGDYGFKCYTGGWLVTLQAGAKLPRYEWSHLVAVIDADNRSATLYRNGEPVATSRCMSPFNVGDDVLLIGKSSADRTLDSYLLNTFNGLIDDITIYNRVLTAAEAAAPAAENAADLSIPAARFASDILRPVFHGMPAAAWTNECHGMAFSNGNIICSSRRTPTALIWHAFTGDISTVRTFINGARTARRLLLKIHTTLRDAGRAQCSATRRLPAESHTSSIPALTMPARR